MKEALDEFFNNTNIFITGGTGFIGKVLIEKLLRSQRNINKLYILMREKKGKSIEDRAKKDIFDRPLFDGLKQSYPNYMEKIVFLRGDILEPELGLNEDDKQRLLNEVNIIFNVAASLNMAASLQYNVKYNVHSVLELLTLCRQMKTLKCICVVSTAYSNFPQNVVEEKIYDTPISTELVLKISQEIDDDRWKKISEPLLYGHPNTYTFSKAVMEAILNQNKDLPIVLFRPAIVISAYSEPVRGWVDNFNGPMGLVYAIGLGVLRAVDLPKEKQLNLISVDMCTNALICSTWHGIQSRLDNNSNNNIMVYNYAWDKIKKTNADYENALVAHELKLEKSIWKPIWLNTPYTFITIIAQIFLQDVPALIIDLLLAAFGVKIRLTRIYQNRIYPAVKVLKPFVCGSWTFKEDNTESMWNSLSDEEKKRYNFDYKSVDFEYLMSSVIMGGKLYLAKEKLEDNYKAVRRHKIILDNHPNTYTFSKSLMENIIKQHQDLPITLFRPAIVSSAYAEPVPGWIDNFNGPSGLIFACALGIFRVFLSDIDKHVNWVPVDMCVNGLICAAWHGSEKRFHNDNQVMVYNYVCEKNKKTWRCYFEALSALDIKLANTIWKPIHIFTKNNILYYILRALVEYIPAIFIDFLLVLSGSKLRLTSIYREKIYPMSRVLRYFVSNEWTFKEDNVYAMWDDLSDGEKKRYPFDCNLIDFDLNVRNFALGIKTFLAKDKYEDNHKAIRRHQILNLVHCLFLIVFWSTIFWILYRFFQ